ncbi:hypothetical protein [Aestuariicoccus sp. MJ-SS9]|uniref:hypothetical protein n=1 Tax=Aestuariicoccus sp. MJ-SS9 TaxID=3079855 RepID=UPI00290F2EDD|nr:hypothetical protein [Aestuariicoccus sp. MJ-SS9]MDU8911915.1 hypothetical protein [Aestuariicoccus sp. MJ-SS9]
MTPERGWGRLDKAAFGLIYGAIMVLSILMAIGDHPETPVRTAVVLFGSVLAVTLAKAFAELMAHALDTGARITRAEVRAAWRHSSPTLAVANLPTLFFLGAAAGLMSAERAVLASQILCIGLLATLGVRVGWTIDRRLAPSLLGGLFAGAVGLALALLKHAIH